jgi:hypothetical protein
MIDMIANYGIIDTIANRGTIDTIDMIANYGIIDIIANRCVGADCPAREARGIAAMADNADTAKAAITAHDCQGRHHSA